MKIYLLLVLAQSYSPDSDLEELGGIQVDINAIEARIQELTEEVGRSKDLGTRTKLESEIKELNGYLRIEIGNYNSMKTAIRDKIGEELKYLDSAKADDECELQALGLYNYQINDESKRFEMDHWLDRFLSIGVTDPITNHFEDPVHTLVMAYIFVSEGSMLSLSNLRSAFVGTDVSEFKRTFREEFNRTVDSLLQDVAADRERIQKHLDDVTRRMRDLQGVLKHRL